MGSTRRNQSNTTNQIDSRQIHETVNQTEIDQRVEDSFNTELTDESTGHRAGGNITIESEAASIAASQAASEAAQKALEEGRRATEAAADALAQAAEGNARAAEKAAEEARKASEASAKAASEAAQAAADVAGDAIHEVRQIADQAIEEARKASEAATAAAEAITDRALDYGEEITSAAFEANENVLKETLSFAKSEGDGNRETLTESFKFLGESLEDANELNTMALTEAFKSTVGGLASEQQQTLLIGLGIVAVMGAIIAFAGRR